MASPGISSSLPTVEGAQEILSTPMGVCRVSLGTEVPSPHPFASTVGSNKCRVNNGGCSSLCLATPRGRQCACAEDQILGGDSVTCQGRLSLMGTFFPHGKLHLVTWLKSCLCFPLGSQSILHPPASVPARGVCLQEQPLHPRALEMRRGQRLPGQQR